MASLPSDPSLVLVQGERDPHGAMIGPDVRQDLAGQDGDRLGDEDVIDLAVGRRGRPGATTHGPAPAASDERLRRRSPEGAIAGDDRRGVVGRELAGGVAELRRGTVWEAGREGAFENDVAWALRDEASGHRGT